MYLNRTVCDVLSEMRANYKTRNFANQLGLIEEVQSMANRMEAALQDQKDLQSVRGRVKEVKQELDELEAERDKLDKQVDDLKELKK